MLLFVMTLARFVRAFGRALKDAEFRALFLVVIGLIGSGTIFYSKVEGWDILDGLYFSVCTLATVGYGDLHPTTPLAKVFTMLYLGLGACVYVAFITKVLATAHEHRLSRHDV
jgi:hypothetical protein